MEEEDEEEDKEEGEVGDEEEEGGDSVPWDDLANEDEPAGSGSSPQQTWPCPWHIEEQEEENMPPELMEMDCFAPSGPSKQREGSKR